MKNALYYWGMPNGTCVDVEQEKIKPVALAVIELRLSKSISQSVSRKFCLII